MTDKMLSANDYLALLCDLISGNNQYYINITPAIKLVNSEYWCKN